MANYLLVFEQDGEPAHGLIEADSARKAVDAFYQTYDLHETEVNSIQVWTLRGNEPRTFTVATETTRTIKQT